MERQAKSLAEQAYVRPDAGRVSQRIAAPAFVDHRPRAVAMRKLAEAMHDSPRMVAQRKLIEGMNAGPAQRQGGPEEE
jgi:hypothetical protein